MDPRFARQYYESASADHWWFSGRQHLVASLVGRLSRPSKPFVDLGAGASSLFPGQLEVIKLDVVRPDPPGDRFVQASAELLPFPDASFDGVGLFDVLEHLSDPASCLAEARRVLSRGQHLFVTVPAHQWLWSPHDDLVGHVRRYTLGGLREELDNAGFRVLWASAFYGFLLAPAFVRKLLRLHSEMTKPQHQVNTCLAKLAVRSASRALRFPTTRGLSIGAVATLE